MTAEATSVRSGVASAQDEIDRVIAEQTPWMRTGEVSAALAKPRERPLATELWRRLIPSADRPRRFRLILGPRRVGKTTVMYQTVRHLLVDGGLPPERLVWARLDHPRLMPLSLDDLVRRRVELAGATTAKPVFLFLDELTYAEQWDAWLKTLYDDGWPVQILGTSSSVAALRHGRTESGVGRWTETYLPPLSFGEYLDVAGIETPEVPVEGDLRTSVERWIDGDGPKVAEDRALGDRLAAHRRRYLLVGGFPELLTAGGRREAGLFGEPGGGGDEHAELLESQRTLRSDAIERAIYKDIPQVFNITEPMKLERLLYSAAGQMAGLFSAESLAKEGGLSGPTVERHVAYLTQSYMIFLLTTWAGSEAKVQRRGRKLYFADGAVRNAALQRGLTPLDDPAEMGLLLENAVAAHLHALAQNEGSRLHHWRKHRREVDFVYAHPDRPIAFEVTAAEAHSLDSVRYLQQGDRKLADASYLVAPGLRPARPAASHDGVGRLPLDWLLLLASRQAAAAIRRA